ncbi:MAG: 4-hydroxy-tetrahydrodipicolinate reductase [Bacteroidales bacterium]
MKIALSGYGRMGKRVEAIALQRGHKITCILNQPDDWQKRQQELAKSDVVIDFSDANSIEDNIKHAHALNIPFVTGTTGWDKKRKLMIANIKSTGNTLFFAPNFSIGVNLLFELNRQLASLTTQHQQYKARINETHHIHKLDAPSGTAIALAEDITKRNEKYTGWSQKDAEAKDTVLIHAERSGEVIGTHSVEWESDIDLIRLEHKAKNRNGFAIGAVVAAEWVKDKKGYFEMADMLF